MSDVGAFEQDITSGSRFEFGKNWQSYLSTLSAERVEEAEKSLCEMLEVRDLKGKRFLDAGSGSGLFSLAARRLGAQVHSFDLDPGSVSCTRQLKSRFCPHDTDWVIEQGSVTDRGFLSRLGEFEIVYSWGVLHHTGSLWEALDNVVPLVDDNGILFLAIYNDQGRRSRFWRTVKRAYCSGIAGKWLGSSVFVPYFLFRAIAKNMVTRRNEFSEYKKDRGMSIYRNWLDWLGGLPYEVAKPDQILRFYRARGFALVNLRTTNSSGNNEYVFLKRRD